MTIDSFITSMRVKQEALYSETVSVARSSADGTFDPVTASYAADTTTSVYAGASLVRPETDGTADAGETSVALDGYTVKLPVDTAVEIGDVVTVTASTYDAGLVGQALRVEEVTNDGWQIARKCRAVVQNARPT